MKRLIWTTRIVACFYAGFGITSNLVPAVRTGWVAAYSILFGLLYGFDLIEADRRRRGVH